MTQQRVEVAQALNMSLGESPLWSVERQTLYWVDINAGVIYAWQTAQSTGLTQMELGEKVGCIALCEGGLLAALASGVVRIPLPFNGQYERLAANPEWLEGQGNRFNDGRCDAAGRFWVGTIDAQESQPTAALYCYREGQLKPQISHLTISNGLAFSPDGRWLYHADSLSRSIQRYPYDVTSGEKGEPHCWVDLDALDLPGVPDGAAVDRQGDYWCALYNGGRVVRFSPQGELVGNYPVPCPHPTMVAFGGKQLDTLYITTAMQHLDAADKERWPLAGSLLQMEVGKLGCVEPSYAAPLA